MPVLALALTGRVGMVVVLRIGFGVIDIALGIMAPLVERPLPAQHLADDVAARLGDDPVALQDLPAGRRHHLERVPGQRAEIDSGGLPDRLATWHRRALPHHRQLPLYLPAILERINIG